MRNIKQKSLIVGNYQHQIAVAAVTVAQGMPVASHTSMPAQPSRPTAMATAAPVKKPTPPPPATSNPPTPSVSVPTPPHSVTPTNTNSMTASPAVSQQPPQQPPTSISSFSSANTPVSIDGTNLSQQSDLMQPYTTMGISICNFNYYIISIIGISQNDPARNDLSSPDVRGKRVACVDNQFPFPVYSYGTHHAAIPGPVARSEEGAVVHSDVPRDQ